MQEAFTRLMSYIHGVWRHRWLALGMAWVIAVSGWIYVAQMPESYVASARVFVDTNSVLRPLMRGLAITPNVNERIALMSRTMLSRPNLERIARMTDLNLQVTNDDQQDALIRRLENSISLAGTRGNNSLYSISVTHPDRETARRITQALITVFIENSMSDSQMDSSGAQSFLDQQLADSERRLIEAEARLANFKQTHVDVLPGESGGYFNRLQQARNNLQNARLQLRELENRRAELNRQLAGEDPLLPNESVGPVNTVLDTRIQNMRMELDTLLTRYTDRHPEIRRLQNLIAELEVQNQLEYEEARNNPDININTLAASPVYQGMRAMLAETQAQAAELQVRVAEYEERVEDLNSKLNQIPEVEAQLTQLDRDYNVIARQHQQMLERRESARLSGDVQQNAGDFSFRVIDPPFVPRTPSHPNKPLLNAGVLLLALGGGVGLALLISLLYPIVTDARTLSQTTGLPLLGAVTYHKSESAVRRERWQLAFFTICVGGLLLAFAVLVVIPGVFT